MLAGLAVGFGVPLLRAASGAERAGFRAVRLVASDGARLSGHWQSWANDSRVPTVAGAVTLRLTGCPGLPRAAGCVYTREPRVVYIRRDVKHPRAILLHELGHVYDLTVMSNRDRGAFRRIMRRPHAQWWAGRLPLAEWFAEAYSWCARYARIVSVARYAIYEYDPTPAQHRATCALIRRAARDRTPPGPAPAPPPVTGDPAPPAAPPVSPSIVPGDPARDPGPAPAETADASSAPPVVPAPTVRTPAPTPVPTASPEPLPDEGPEAEPEPGPDEEPEPEPTPDDGPAPEPTAEPTPEETPEAEPTPTAEPSPTADPSPEPTPTEDPTPEPTPRRG